MIRIISCGRMKEKWMQAGAAEYLKRLGSYDRMEIIEVTDEKAPESNSDAENEAVKKIEGERLLKAIKPQDYVILLDLKGKTLDSVQLSEKIQDLQSHGRSRIDFVIGGSLGLSRELIQRADFRWKISDNTFPHQLCKIIVLEQVYRSFRILHHEPYHK
ncbi:MAG: 23S rRNA (pseudouridine(1915)-N(3))-methyltransferase RlmH [Erysipelotrichia bacterium]|nr:23S rRNA (pseudouridine(1915)-N(3))-methyltransferase RlmH [Erysipelotrichia bacterium]